jgi:hypothetical protein
VGWYVVEGVDGMGRVSGGVRRAFLYGWEMGDWRWEMGGSGRVGWIGYRWEVMGVVK